jgi:uncharacterized protein YdeI (YjbR/CyaY-like superfamily)
VDGVELLVETRHQWRAWLEANHATSTGIWVVTWRAPTGRPSPSYEDVVQEALCFGWVDSQQKPVDDERSALRFTPRTKGSPWARTNKRRIELLRRSGLMAAAGERVVAAAQADGSWSIFDDVDNLVMPDDLTAALEAHPPAADNFAAFTPSQRRAALQWIILAKRPQTRAGRVARVATEAQNNRRAAP